MGYILNYSINDLGVTYSITSENEYVLPDQWSLIRDRLKPNSKSAIPILLGLRESESIIENDRGEITIPHNTVAGLTNSTIGKLGLPCPFEGILYIEGSGLISDTDFRIIHKLRSPSGRPYYIDSITGAFITVGNEMFIIREPYYSIISQINEFNSRDNSQNIENLRSWAAIKELLPENAIIDDYLQSINILLCSSFTLGKRLDENDEITFDPIPVKRDNTINNDPLEDNIEINSGVENAVPILPPDLQYSFARNFRRFQEARSQYALEDGWIIIIDDEVLPGLKAVRNAQKLGQSERLDFLNNPYAGIRELSGDTLDSDTIDKIFTSPDEYGARVQDIGKFIPPILPFVKHSGNVWTPPESIGFSICGKLVLSSNKDVTNLLDQLKEAYKTGNEWINYKEVEIPVNERSIRAVDTLIEAINRFNPKNKGKSKSAPSVYLQQALLLGSNANIEDLKFMPSYVMQREGECFKPKALLSALKPHQVDGLNWLQNHWLRGSPGAILADDMGLGKTIQSLAFICWIKELKTRNGKKCKPFLIVAPTGLLKNWIDEHNIHFESSYLGKVIGAFGNDLKKLKNTYIDTKDKKELSSGTPILDTNKIQSADWVLTTYETLRDYSHSFGSVCWEAIIFDEAQKIKNPAVLISEQARAVASNADFVLAMTGTPVENRMSDLWSIADTCHSGILGDLKTFSKIYEGDYENVKDSLFRLQGELINTGDKEPIRLVLRRMKCSNLNGLPPRNDDVKIRINMPEMQRNAYHSIIDNATPCDNYNSNMLKVLFGIRTVSLHPTLAEEANLKDEEFIGQSARLIGAFNILNDIYSKQEKVLIFLESRVLQPVIQGIIQRKYHLNNPPLIINGDVSGLRRKDMVDVFQESAGFNAMILSPKAGGVGLTLTAANNVIHLSRWWNPAVEDQCTDRIYRIGQKKSINVYIPMSVFSEKPGTSFDEKLDDLLSRKRNLSQAVLAPIVESDKDIQKLYTDIINN